MDWKIHQRKVDVFRCKMISTLCEDKDISPYIIHMSIGSKNDNYGDFCKHSMHFNIKVLQVCAVTLCSYPIS